MAGKQKKPASPVADIGAAKGPMASQKLKKKKKTSKGK